MQYPIKVEESDFFELEIPLPVTGLVSGAGDGYRTRDLLVGNETFYY